MGDKKHNCYLVVLRIRSHSVRITGTLQVITQSDIIFRDISHSERHFIHSETRSHIWSDIEYIGSCRCEESYHIENHQ